MVVAIGLFLCLGGYLAGRALARRLLGIPVPRLFSRSADPRYFTLAAGRRLAWRLAGPLAAYLLAVVLAFGLKRADGETFATTRIEVRPEGPAAIAGLARGDRIVAVGGEPVHAWPDVQRLVAAAGGGKPVAITIERGDVTRSFGVITNAGARIGVSPIYETASTPVARALAEAVPAPVRDVVQAVRTQASDFTGQEKTDLMGPVGIVHQLTPEGERPGARKRFLLMLFAYSAGLAWPITIVLEILLRPRRAGDVH
jgi:membrane-associated protease RseP (regulator of RpoE activity)